MTTKIYSGYISKFDSKPFNGQKHDFPDLEVDFRCKISADSKTIQEGPSYMFDKKTIDIDDKIIYLERHTCGEVPMKVVVKMNMAADKMSVVRAYNSSIKEMEAHNEKVINMKATLFNILMSMLSTEMQNLIKGCGAEPYLSIYGSR